ncbi:MAG: carbon-nitrogen hydrolase family protein [Halobacteriota archaeon]|nr:carbon-nitrogen hydrolase family protein [Halobacteriota archaeon]
MSEIVAASIQMRIGGSLDQNIEEADRLIKDAADRGAQVVCLPEYFSIPHAIIPSKEVYLKVHERTIDFLRDASRDYNLIVAGTMIESKEGGYFNTCFIYERGRLLGKQTKVHLTEREEKFGLKHGDEFLVFESGIGVLGVLICADVLYPEAGRILGLKGAEIVLNPVVSFYRDDDPTREARSSMFVSRSYDNDYFLLKAGGVGKSQFGTKIVGRSLITAPWGVLASAKDENGSEIVIASLDMNLLKEVKKEDYSLYRRIKEAYRPLVE